MRRVRLVQVGVGRVGRALVRVVASARERLRRDHGLDLGYRALLRRGRVRWGEVAGEEVPEDGWCELAAAEQALPGPGERDGVVLVDVSASPTGPLLEAALAAGVPVATANKLPLAGSQQQFDALQAAARRGGVRLGYECTVGAALPVIRTLRGMLATGDDLLEIQGSLSGTLGYVMHRLAEGAALGAAVREAHGLGYTEPDPRDDLDGRDVARKALILSRTAGWPAEAEGVALVPLVPIGDPSLGVDEFLARLDDAPPPAARRREGVPRYVARVRPDGIEVGPRLEAAGSVWATLGGADNLVRLRSRRYDDRPLVIQGAGAGPELTAAGVLEDILEVAR